jgi:hypothetical protein
MKILENFKYILFLSAIILILMIIKVCQNNNWPGDAGKAADIVALRNNYITLENLNKIKGPVTLIRMGLPVPGNRLSSFPGVNVSWEGMLEKQFLRKIKQTDHTCVIVSGSHTDGMKAWVLLNQMGVKDLYILDQEEMNNELLKYQFQPDTTISLELESTEK